MSSPEPISIAVIGMGCRFPGGASSPEELWSIAAEGRHGWSEVPLDRFNWSSFYHPDTEVSGTTNQKGGHFLDQSLAAFDAGFFGVPPREAEAMDPQQRVVLEAAWDAVENAGIPMEKLRGSDTAVFVAMFGHDYEHATTKDSLLSTKYHNTGAARPLLANRVSYVFDLHGPSATLDTGCSGSLVAVNSACQSLRLGESDMALAGGVAMMFSPDQLAMMAPTGIFNSEGRCFSFDSRGKGYGRGEGVGIVALKRLDDAIRDGDNVRAIIRNSAANQDGRTNGITLPNQFAQERLARKVFQGLPFSPSDVDYVEAHGTGTKAGDFAELSAISNVFGSDRAPGHPVYVGTGKPNIGHSEAASGSAGLIKTIVGMEKGLIHPQILLENFKPQLIPVLGKVKIARSLEPWPSTKVTRKAVVNCFGSGGTNVMLVLEAPEIAPQGRINGTNGNSNGTTHNGYHNNNHAQNGSGNGTGNGSTHSNGSIGESRLRLFPLSARSEYSLINGIDDLKSYLERKAPVDLDNLSYTLASRRSGFQWRCSVVAEDVDSLVKALETKDLKPVKAPVQVTNVFVFTGQGAQYFQVGYALLGTKSEFTRSIHHSDAVLRKLGATWSLVEELSKDEDSTRLNDSKFGQPASTAIQVALVDLLKSWSVLPSAVIGHSSGEIAAAYAAGAITHDAAVRAAYERSFLADAAKKHLSQQGAMMAVGAGEEEALRYIKKLMSPGVVVACINSPSSTTVSGDAAGIEELQGLLQAQGIFARRLKVDTAYHSHHMKVVSNEYLARLKGLQSSSTSSSVRFFSTVTSQEKHKGFGASYWVDNLVSQVRFSDALELLGKELCQGPLNLIEIGPHKALAGPIRQSLASLQTGGLPYRYIPTLVRDQNSVTAILDTGASLFIAGSEVDVGAVASLGISDPSPKVLGDLPHYHWNHTVDYWREPRLSKEYRCRPYPHHDLLGVRTLTSPDSEPSWRMILTVDSLPWLKDHVVDNFVVFPGSGYMAMAIEGLKQLNKDAHPNMATKAYHLRNISFKRTLSIPDNLAGVEVMLNLSHSTSNEYSFRVSSIAGGKWQEHCDGYISAEFEAAVDEVDQDREASFSAKSHLEKFEDAARSCGHVVQHADIYTELSSFGNQYGPSFAAVHETRLGTLQALSKITLPDVASQMPSRFMQPHVIHPSTLDAILHSCVLLFQREALSRGSTMPVFIGEVSISTDMTTQPGAQLRAVTDLRNTYSQSSNFDVVVIQDGPSGNQQPVVTISNGEVRIVGASQEDSQTSGGNAFNVEWGLDVSSITAEDLESAVLPIKSNGIRVELAEKAAILDSASARYIGWATKKIREGGLTIKSDYRASYFSWMVSFIESNIGRKLIQRIPDSEAEVAEQLARVGVEGEMVRRIGTKLVSILTGEVDPLSVVLEDDLLFRVEKSNEIARVNQYVAEFTRRLSFQNKEIRVLEIGAGAGAGGATLPLLQLCSPNGESFASEYTVTDVSSELLNKVLEERLKDWGHLLTFRTLDIEKDPIGQGFDQHGYDLILASDVLRATPSLSKSLDHISRLLKPGGIFGTIEATKATPWRSLIFGLLPGRRTDADDGGAAIPPRSVEQWSQRLRDASFSGVNLVAHGSPEAATQRAFITSTSAPVVTTNGRHAHRVEILNAIPEGHTGHKSQADIIKNLSKYGLEPSARDWEIRSIDESVSYVVLDSATRPLLAHATPEQFDHIVSLVSKGSKVYWITFADGSNGLVPDFGLATGFARSALSEIDSLKFFTLNVQDNLDDQGRVLSRVSDFVASSEAKIARGDTLEFEYMLKDEKLHIQRLASHVGVNRALASTDKPEREDCLFHQEERRLKIQIEKPGLLSSLTFVDDKLGELGPDEVEVQPYACGVNFKDVFVALGQMTATQTMCGECAGVVTRVGSNFASTYKIGQRVAAISGTPYASRARTNGHLIYPIPDSLSFTDAATVPVAFSTAYYGLVDSANLRRGQTVLIHAASGGLGQAAVMIAQHIGAEIFATVGSDAKRRVLIEKYGIPEDHIFSSRTLSFKAGVLRKTAGKGVDVVLNSLSGDALRATWKCMASMGTFVEVGKTDIYQRSRLDMDVFDRNVRFASVDLIVLSKCRPQDAQGLLKRVFGHFEAGHYSPLPVTPLPIANIEQAFRLIQARKHTGKIVLEADASSIVSARVRPFRLRDDGTYVIVGGLGNLGRHICRHLQRRGARHLVLLSRRRFEQGAREALEAALVEVPGSTVKVVACDILDGAEVSRVAGILRGSLPPIRGVIQAAMVLADRTLAQMKWADFETAMRPKYDGTRNVAAAFADAALEFFVALSSIAGIIGLRGQANYAAGNAFEDMFAQAHSGGGDRTHFVSLNLPLVAESAAKTAEVVGFVQRQGVQVLPVAAVLPLLDYAMGRAAADGVRQVVLGLDGASLAARGAHGGRATPLLGHVYARARQLEGAGAGAGGDGAAVPAEKLVAQAPTAAAAELLVLEATRDKVAALLGVEREELRLDASVAALGLDSLVAIELKNWLAKTLRAAVQTSDITDAPSLRALAALVTRWSELVPHEPVDDAAADGAAQPGQETAAMVVDGDGGM
ncbi:putative polyketide synthase [Durotheca rogersii]|uniref:putative polyketide synthase n=1 Tax=Durotheca rogersii TaxID=419775 RepID=UPI00221EB7C9|nr:putative polyketide synthase [Durotheca rogersii]KAI5865300.1 putative polyketide synthase [Durotheca rogersii]